MRARERALRSTRNSLLCGVAVLAFAGSVACARKEQATEDLQVRDGYSLVRKDPKAALEKFARAKDPESYLALHGKGLAHEALGELELAHAAQSAAHQAFPKNPDALVALGRIELMQGKQDAAWRHLDTAAELRPSDLETVLLLTLVARNEPQLAQVLPRLRGWAPPAGSSERDAAPGKTYYRTLQFAERALGHSKEARDAAAAAASAPLRGSVGALTLAQMAVRCQKPALAATLVEDLARQATTDTVRVEMAELALAVDRVPAAKRLADLVPSGPEPRGYLARARSYLRSGDAAGAVKEYRAALERIPQDAKERSAIRVELGRALARAQGVPAGIGELKSVVEQSPKLVSAHVLLAQWESQVGRSAAAAARLEDALRTEPKAIPLWEALGMTQLRAKNYAEAQRACREAAKRAPKSGRPRLLLGEALDAEGSPAAEAEFRAAVELEPSNMEYRARLAEYHLRHQQADAALDVFRKAQGAKIPEAELQFAVARVYLKLGRPEAAIDTLEAHVARAPRHVASWLLLNQLFEQQRPEAVRGLLERAVRQAPEAPALRALLAQALMTSGDAKDKQEAARHYETLLELAAGDAVALNNLAMLYADELNQPKRAVELAERAFQLQADHPAIADTLAWSLYRRGSQGDLARARNLLEVAVSERRSPAKLYHLGAVELALKHREAATSALRAALEPGPGEPLDSRRAAEVKRLLVQAQALRE